MEYSLSLFPVNFYWLYWCSNNFKESSTLTHLLRKRYAVVTELISLERLSIWWTSSFLNWFQFLLSSDNISSTYKNNFAFVFLFLIKIIGRFFLTNKLLKNHYFFWVYFFFLLKNLKYYSSLLHCTFKFFLILYLPLYFCYAFDWLTVPLKHYKYVKKMKANGKLKKEVKKCYV